MSFEAGKNHNLHVRVFVEGASAEELSARGGITVVWRYDAEAGVVVMRTAYCHPKDNYSRKVGVATAMSHPEIEFDVKALFETNLKSLGLFDAIPRLSVMFEDEPFNRIVTRQAVERLIVRAMTNVVGDAYSETFPGFIGLGVYQKNVK